MTKEDLIKRVQQANPEVDQQLIDKIVRSTIDAFVNILNIRDVSLFIRGFGTFKNVLSNKTTARDIGKNKTIKIERKRKIIFKHSKTGFTKKG